MDPMEIIEQLIQEIGPQGVMIILALEPEIVHMLADIPDETKQEILQYLSEMVGATETGEVPPEEEYYEDDYAGNEALFGGAY